jgi:hypothetical protein
MLEMAKAPIFLKYACVNQKTAPTLSRQFETIIPGFDNPHWLREGWMQCILDFRYSIELIFRTIYPD